MRPERQAGKTILVVEDDGIMRGAMKMVLEWECYRVRCAANGREALDLLHGGEKPSVILLDLTMRFSMATSSENARRRAWQSPTSPCSSSPAPTAPCPTRPGQQALER
jgi:CheY-like chemotaxis protein